MLKIQSKKIRQIKIFSYICFYKKKLIMEKIVSIKILRPITLTIIGIFLITYIIVAYVFDLEM